jgi:hypothetical protein
MSKIKPLVERFSSRYWKSEVSRAKKRSEEFVKMAEESIKVFNAHKNIGFLSDSERRLNCWWYCNNTLLPAYYSSTPKAEVSLRKRTGGIVEELSAIALERNIQYDMDTEFPFDLVGHTLATHYLLTGRAVSWARYEAEIEEEEVDLALIKGPDGNLTDDKGEPFKGEILEQKPGLGNIVLVKIKTSKKSDECALLEPVQYDDYLCSDARTEMEVTWRARRAYLNREEANKLFGENIAQDLHYDAVLDKERRSWNKENDEYDGKAEVWEIWCKESESVYWGHFASDDFIFYKSEPPIEFEGFFPCSVITQGSDPDSVIPVSDYAHVRDQILEVERLTTRIAAVTLAIRTNFIFDPTLGSQVTELFTDDLKGIPATNWPSYKSRGGLASAIEFVEIAPYINALQVLQTAREQALQQLYETLKVSDLLRGTSEQYKSATANRLEAQWSSLGLVVRQNMFAKFMSDGIDKLGQIIASQFSPEYIAEVADLNRLIESVLPPPPPPPEAPPLPEGMPPEMAPPPPPAPDPAMWIAEQTQQMTQQIMDLLKNEDRRCYRIQIASDSMVAIDQAQEQQEGAQLMSSAGEFFNQMRSLIEQYPPLLGFSIELFQNVIKRFKGGKEVDGLFTKALSQIGEVAKAKEEAAKQPPPPDPTTLEMQARMQIAQMESQARIQATQMQMQDAHEKNMLAYQEQQVKLQRHQLESQLMLQKQQFEEYLAQQELAIKQQEVQVKANAVQVDMLKIQAASEGEQAKQAITQEANRMAGILDIQKLELEQMRIRLSESEKLMEERRLASESQLERMRMQMETINTKNAAAESGAMKQQPIVINNIIPKASKKLGTIGTDALGNTTLSIDNIDED